MNKLIMILLLLAPPLFSLTPEQELFSRAEDRYKAENFSVAIEFYDNFIRTYPLSRLIPDAQFRKTICLYRVKRYNECLTLLEKIRSRYKSTSYYRYINFWSGLTLYHLEDYTRSIDSFSSFLEEAENDELISQSMLYKGMGEVMTGGFEEARVTILQLTTDYKDSVYYNNGILLLAYAYYKLQLYDEIITLVDSLAPDSFKQERSEKLLFYKAEAFTGKKMAEEANTLYKQVLTASQEISSVAFRRLFLYEQAGKNFSEMEKLLQQAETHFSGSYQYLKDFWVQVGIESFKQENYELAEHMLNKVWNIRGKENISSSIPLYLAEIQLTRGDNSKAKGFLDEYMSLQEDTDGAITMRLGDIYLKDNNYSKASEYYKKFVDGYPSSPRFSEASYFLAYTYYKQNNTDEARKITTGLLNKISSGKYYKETLKLQAYLLKNKDNRQETITAFQAYISSNPGDIKALIDLLKLRYRNNEFNKVVEETEKLFKNIPLLESEDNNSYIMGRYLQGLSYVSVKEYAKAIEGLTAVKGIKAGSAGLSEIVPYAIFYKGWSYYKLSRFEDAIGTFKQIINNYSSHSIAGKAFYFTAWSYYTSGLYEEAVTYFSNLLRMKTDKDMAAKANFFMAKANINLKKRDEAAKIYKHIYISYPKTGFADDAMYEYALIQAELGNINDAVKSLAGFTTNYPGSPLVEEAYYKIGEIYFRTEKYDLAQEAFYKYRTGFPQGTMLDSALYWGGLAAYNIKELYGAALLWEILIKKHEKSVFRADAMARVAEIYAGDGEYNTAIQFYGKLQAEYPVEAANLKARQRTEELRYLILGLDDKEAELSAAVDRNKGIQTPEGRLAMLELAKFYIFKEDVTKMDLAYKMLVSLVTKNAEKDSVARARFLTGEYYLRKNEYIKAGNEFLKAAVTNPANKDLMAVSILKAAEMMKKAGKNKDVKDLVEKLEQNFPSSQWTIEGKKLLEGIE